MKIICSEAHNETRPNWLRGVGLLCSSPEVHLHCLPTPTSVGRQCMSLSLTHTHTHTRTHTHTHTHTAEGSPSCKTFMQGHNFVKHPCEATYPMTEVATGRFAHHVFSPPKKEATTACRKPPHPGVCNMRIGSGTGRLGRKGLQG